VAGTPALVITTESGAQDRAAAQQAGANYFLVKPVAPEVLIAHADAMSGRAA
jgi:two-component system chemotaxis response regulator CheY